MNKEKYRVIMKLFNNLIMMKVKSEQLEEGEEGNKPKLKNNKQLAIKTKMRVIGIRRNK